jgi:predicted site-specific integrase-resolvase
MNIFCNDKSISSRCLARYMNKGKIPPYKQGKDLPDRINTTNWEIIRL